MFFYCKQTDWTPKNSIIYCIKNKKELIPLTYQSDGTKQSSTYKTFIYGKGWIKSKNLFEVPQYKGTTKTEFDTYLKEYGKEALFTSITGWSLFSSACCATQAIREFNVTLSIGYDYVKTFLNEITEVNTIITSITEQKLKENNKTYNSSSLFTIKPSYSIMGFFLTKPHIDIFSDDKTLEKHYDLIFNEDYKENNPLPISVKERIEFLFNYEVADRYYNLLTNYPF